MDLLPELNLLFVPARGDISDAFAPFIDARRNTERCSLGTLLNTRCSAINVEPGGPRGDRYFAPGSHAVYNLL
jgi:hypothetical protein